MVYDGYMTTHLNKYLVTRVVGGEPVTMTIAAVNAPTACRIANGIAAARNARRAR